MAEDNGNTQTPWWVTVFGFLMVAAAFLALFMKLLPPWALVILAVLGGFFISMSRMQEFMQSAKGIKDILK